jgi:leucyl/phenylalanyl-tRNA--protein transferase
LSNEVDEPSLEDVLNAYCNGIFPMASLDDDGVERVGWYDPPMRGVIPLDLPHIPRSFKKYMRQHIGDYIVSVNSDFDAVIDACAAPNHGREETWINDQIKTWFCDLHRAGFAHSIELRSRDSVKLLGGLYGLSVGGAFMGESMFSHQPQASKICLATLMGHMIHLGMSVLDTQFVNDHLLQFGCVEIPKTDYLSRLHQVLNEPIRFIDDLERTEISGKIYQIIPEAQSLAFC